MAHFFKHYITGVDYVENLIREQLLCAIGKELSAEDFTEYMDFHNRKLFKPSYRLKHFSYAVRFEDKAPEGIFFSPVYDANFFAGVISIEGQLPGKPNPQPILAITKASKATSPMYFNLNAAAKVSFMGERYHFSLELAANF